MQEHEHYCGDIENYPPDKFLQFGIGKGTKVLIVGESPAPNGWRKSGKAFYTIEGKILPTGRNLNKLLEEYGLSVERCGFTELVKCYVGKDRHLLSSCGKKCWEIFTKQLKAHEFSFLIILGVKTLELFNKCAKLGLKIGKIVDAKIDGDAYTILPIYHPSPVSPTGHKNNIKIFERNRKVLKSLFLQD